VFRPQYALPLMALLLLSRHYRAFRWSIATAALTWVIDAVMLGPFWVTDWMAGVSPFLSTDAVVNGHNAIAVTGFLQAIFGTESSLAFALGALTSLAIAAILAEAWWRGTIGLNHLVAMTATGILLISPHTMFYDGGLIVITAAILVGDKPSRWPLVPILIIAATTQVAASTLGFSPFALVVLAVFIMARRAAQVLPVRSVSAAPVGV